MRFDIDRFYILHVEDEPDYASIDTSSGSPVYEGILREPVETVLAEHGIAAERIEWHLASDAESALALMERADRSAGHRGFDSIFCDLRIPPSQGKSDEKSIEQGLRVAERAANYRWPCALIGLTQWARDKDVLDRKISTLDRLEPEGRQRPVFDDFLMKEELSNRELCRAKLRRSLVPTARYAKLAASRWDPPAFFLGKEMWRILRELVLISRRPALDWPLPLVLLLGESGSGKGMLARAYDQLLRRQEHGSGMPRPRMEVVNCASLVAQGHGGRIRLFGCGQGFQGVNPQPGVFETATRHLGQATSKGLASADAEPDYAAGGVVFLDEFVELNTELQAAVLNALQEGVVYREGDGSPVKIGCQVIFATNADIRRVMGTGEALASTEDGSRLREDLVDRIPYLISVPSVLARRDDVPDLIRHFAATRLNRTTAKEEIPHSYDDISIEQSALQIIERAVGLGLVHSVRQLQLIADVLPGETSITDSNLAWILQRAKILGMPLAALTSNAEELRLSDKASALGLPSDLWRDELPEPTASNVNELYGRLVGERPHRDPNALFAATPEGEERRRRYYLLARLLSKARRAEVFGSETDKLRQRWHKAAKKTGLELSSRDHMKNVELITTYLLS